MGSVDVGIGRVEFAHDGSGGQVLGNGGSVQVDGGWRMVVMRLGAVGIAAGRGGVYVSEIQVAAG